MIAIRTIKLTITGRQSLPIFTPPIIVIAVIIYISNVEKRPINITF